MPGLRKESGKRERRFLPEEHFFPEQSQERTCHIGKGIFY
jgi:hypothetical protein